MLKKYLLYTIATFLGFSGAELYSEPNAQQFTQQKSLPETKVRYQPKKYKKSSDQLETKQLTCYVTKTGSKYHTEDCYYLKNSMYGVALQNAINKGYTSCSRCDPRKVNLSFESNFRSAQSINTTSDVLKNTYAVQCSGITLRGHRCKRKTKNSSGYCFHHN